MTRGTGRTLLTGLTLALLSCVAAAETKVQKEPAAKVEKVDGYAEWHVGPCLIADAQKVCPAPGLKFKGGGEAKDVATIPVGYELKAKGTRLADGSLLASEIEAKPNGAALFEGEVKAATDAAEAAARQKGRFYQDPEHDKGEVGRLHEDGPYVERVRRIVDDLLPPYLSPEAVRIYVIENKEWNAFAMGNYSIYVFTGLLDDMDDDEVAIVLGHELVHATHEHSRKEFKRQMWVQLAALGIEAASTKIDDEKKRAVVQLATGLAATAYSSGYSRGMEDQADRVGLRYAFEAGYDITKGPRLWNRFAKKYGEGNKVQNFFFSDHSLSAARATKLEKEIAFNYPDGPKPGGPARAANGRSGAAAPSVHRAPSAPPETSQALVAPRTSQPPKPPTARAAARPAPAPANQIEIEPGMTQDQVRKALGEPTAVLKFGDKVRWTYPDVTVVFEKGKVTDVMF